MCAILDHPLILSLIGGALGEYFNYCGGDRNYYTGDTGWHPDVEVGVNFVDLDNDGCQDIFVTNGHIYENAEEIHEGVNTFSSYAQLNHCSLNLGDGTFTEVSSQSGSGFLINKVSRGGAFADYDNDGDLDILITNSNQKLRSTEKRYFQHKSLANDLYHWYSKQQGWNRYAYQNHNRQDITNT